MAEMIHTAVESHEIIIETQYPDEKELVEKGLVKALGNINGSVGIMCRRLLSAGGKRLRPLLVVYSGLLSGGLSNRLIQAAAAAELIHMASLIHDDVIDEAGVRRSRPTANKLWGNRSAVLCGDYLFARAFGIMTENRLLDSMDQMVEAIKCMCSAEILQAESAYCPDTTIDQYYSRIAGKTASFLACCCRSGAFCSGAPQEDVERLGEYGMNLGYAFQIMDDILDFQGDANVTGKPVYEDITHGIVTLPVIYMLESGCYGWVEKALSNREVTREQAFEIGEIVRTEGFLQRAAETADIHSNKAILSLNGIKKSCYTDKLAEIAYSAASRTS